MATFEKNLATFEENLATFDDATGSQFGFNNADNLDGEHPEPPTLLQADRRQKPTEVSNEDGVEPGTPSAAEAGDPPQESLFDRYRWQMLPD